MTRSTQLDEERPGERHKQERRRQIVHAATEVFAEFGYHGASIGQIIDRAGIARGTFYLYFESKSAVFAAILDEAIEGLRARIFLIDVSTPGAPAPQVQLRQQLVAAISFVTSLRALAVLLLRAGHTPDAEAAERLDQFWSEVRTMIERALRTGAAIGLVRPCVPALTAAALLGMARGIVELLVSSPEVTAEAAIAELQAVALHGILRG